MRFLAFALAALAVLPAGAVAPPYDRLFPGATFDPSIPTLESVVGVAAGVRPLRHAELMRYLQALDEAAPHAALRPYARSHEGRDLVLLAISDPATIAGLDRFREEHAERADPRRDVARPADAKAVAWLAYGIHGDELSSVDAAVAVAYRLVAGTDPLARRLREELVILIDPIENPDGRERFLAQTTAFAHREPNADPEDLSHTAVWPWGRGNHYLFDLNRDWFTMVHPESERSALIAAWSPQLVVDSHEMGSDDTYLFSPPRHPFNPHLPAHHARWAKRFAADQARALDARGYAYYTGEWNEEFFPGYGSSWASYGGAIGILYEMSSTEGTLVRQRAGTLRTYAEAIEHQVASSMANLETLATHRQEILRDVLASRRALAIPAEGAAGAWILPRGVHPERTDALAHLLRRQGIEVLRARGRARQAWSARDARTGATVGSRDLPEAGAWLVPLDQPAGALARVLLDPHVPMESKFLREEREYLERGRGTRLYETTAWALPLAYGIESWWTPVRPAGADWDAADEPESARGSFEGGSAPYGYVFEGTSDGSVGALAALLSQGVAARVAEDPFRVDGRAYDRGAVLVKREGNPAGLEATLGEVAASWPVVIHAVPTAKAQAGPDLGGGRFHPLVAPRVGIWTGPAINPGSYGALWHLFDEVLHLRFSGLELSRFSSTDLSRYNVLIFPPSIGGAGTYRAHVRPDGLEALKRWIDAGGTAIGIGNGAEYLADADAAVTKARLRRQALERFPPVVLGLTAEEALEVGPYRAGGLRAAPPEKDEEKAKPKTARATTQPRSGPYDVAPLVGPGARPFLARHEQGTAASLRPVALSEWTRSFLAPGQDKPDKKDLEWADARLRRFAPRGTFLRADVDRQVWMAWGLPEELPALVRADDALVAESPVEIPARFGGLDDLHLGGLLWPEAAGRLARTAYTTREAVGRGQVILFLSEPEFRGYTLGTRRLLTNAILYGPGLGTQWSAPW